MKRFFWILFLPLTLLAQYQGGAGSGYFLVSLDTAFCMTFPDTARGSGYAMDFLNNAFCMIFPDTARGSGYVMDSLDNAFCMTFPDTARGSGYAMNNADSSNCSMFTAPANINSGYNVGDFNNALCNFFTSTTDSGGPYDMSLYSDLNCAPFFSSGSGSGYGVVEDTCLVPLPFSLMNLQAEAFPNYNKVYWLVSIDQGDFYELQKSFDNVSYKSVEQYTLYEDEPISQQEFNDYRFRTKTYYRLKVYFKNGKYQYSTPVLVLRQELPASETQIAVFPNPVSRGNYLFIETSEDMRSIALYSLTGKLLAQTSEPRLLMDYPSGLYFIKILFRDGTFASRKVVIWE